MVVNNGAGAVLLAAAALAGAGRDVVVSRGQLVEIGGGFRIPEVVAQSGRPPGRGRDDQPHAAGRLRAGARPSGDRVGAILRVHPSNFRSVGFVEDVSIEALCGLGAPVIDDVGSGVLADAPGSRRSATSRRCKRSVARRRGAGLLLGRQAARRTAGRPAGRDAPRRSRPRARHPLARALRIDKLSLAALEATLAPVPRSASARGGRSRCWRCSTATER